MAQDNRLRMPSSGAGVMTYSDEYKSRFMLTPNHVLILIGVVVFFIVLLHLL